MRRRSPGRIHTCLTLPTRSKPLRTRRNSCGPSDKLQAEASEWRGTEPLPRQVTESWLFCLARARGTPNEQGSEIGTHQSHATGVPEYGQWLAADGSSRQRDAGAGRYEGHQGRQQEKPELTQLSPQTRCRVRAPGIFCARQQPIQKLTRTVTGTKLVLGSSAIIRGDGHEQNIEQRKKA